MTWSTVEVIWSPRVPAVAIAIAIRAILLAALVAAALIAHRRGRPVLWTALFIVLGLFICTFARLIEYPLAQFLYGLLHPQTSVGFWRMPEAGFWSAYADWLAPVLGVILGALSANLFRRREHTTA